MSDTPTVTIYSTSWCGFCRMVEKYLDDKGVKHVTKDIEQDPAAYSELMQKIGNDFRGVPVSDINGTMVLGFDRPAIDDALSK